MGTTTDAAPSEMRRKSKSSGPGGHGPGAHGAATSASGRSGFPPICSGPAPRSTAPTQHLAALRAQADGIPDPARAALALNILTEEGLPHFHRLLAVYLGDDSFWRIWNNLWTAEEDRHGTGAPRLRPGHPPVQPAEDRGDAVRVPPRRVPPRVGPGSVPGLRLHHGPGAGHPVLPRRDRQGRGRVRAAARRGAWPGRQGRGAALHLLPQGLRRDPQARSGPGAPLRFVHPSGHRHAGSHHARVQGAGRRDPAGRASTGRGTTCGSCRSRSGTGRSRACRGWASWAGERRRKSWESRHG